MARRADSEVGHEMLTTVVRAGVVPTSTSGRDVYYCSKLSLNETGGHWHRPRLGMFSKSSGVGCVVLWFTITVLPLGALLDSRFDTLYTPDPSDP